jgi:Tol biopolymer transport system component
MRLLLTIVVAASVSAATPTPTPPPPVHGAAPAVSPDGTRIAFLSERGGATDVYVIGADGAGEIRLTNTPLEEGQLSFSADGKAVWFSVFADGTASLFSVSAEGGNAVPRGSVPGRVLRVSPDGRRVLYWTGGWTAMRMWASNLDGSQAVPLTDGKGVVWGARWSQDGRRIAFADRDASGHLHVYVIEADGTGRRQATRLEQPDLNEQMPAFSPDGTKLAVQAGAARGPTRIWIVDVETGGGVPIDTGPPPAHDEVPVWFPDGKRLAYQSDRSGRMEIWVMNSDGSGNRQVTR